MICISQVPIQSPLKFAPSFVSILALHSHLPQAGAEIRQGATAGGWQEDESSPGLVRTPISHGVPVWKPFKHG